MGVAGAAGFVRFRPAMAACAAGSAACAVARSSLHACAQRLPQRLPPTLRQQRGSTVLRAFAVSHRQVMLGDATHEKQCCRRQQRRRKRLPALRGGSSPCARPAAPRGRPAGAAATAASPRPACRRSQRRTRSRSAAAWRGGARGGNPPSSGVAQSSLRTAFFSLRKRARTRSGMTVAARGAASGVAVGRQNRRSARLRVSSRSAAWPPSPACRASWRAPAHVRLPVALPAVPPPRARPPAGAYGIDAVP